MADDPKDFRDPKVTTTGTTTTHGSSGIGKWIAIAVGVLLLLLLLGWLFGLFDDDAEVATTTTGEPVVVQTD